jgi:hypothetical protein
VKARNQKKRLAARIADYFKSIEKMRPEQAAAFHCPGSNKK